MAASEEKIVDVFWHDDMLQHVAGKGVFDSMWDPGWLDVLEDHPENATRVKNMLSMLRRGPIRPYVRWHEGRKASVDELYSFHTKEYVQELIDADASGGRLMANGTNLAPGSWHATLVAAGTTLEAMRAVLSGTSRIALALVRPPGHHAQPSTADGYCFINNAGLAIHLALQSGCKRVACIDIDVHYGNGTAEGFYDRDDVLTASFHMNHGSWGPSHTQTAQPDEVGRGKGVGYNLNIPLPTGSGDRSYELAFHEIVAPAVDQFQPDFIVAVIGQDANQFCPNGRNCLTMDGFRRLGQLLRGLSHKFSQGRMLMVQEGGYQITYAPLCLMATLEGALELPEPLCQDPIAYYPEDLALAQARVAEIKSIRAAAIASLSK